MILLDTNVVSETMRPRPDDGVLAWVDAQQPDKVFLSTVTQAELLLGAAVLPEGRRKDNYRELLDEMFGSFDGRILPFDSLPAMHYAWLAADARARGKTLPLADGYIAAIAAAHGMTVATRDTAPFIAAGVPVVNPWQ